jgi:hypothetical protein
MVDPFFLPKRYPVNSTDYLLLLFHKQLRKQGKCGNVVRTVLHWEGKITVAEIQEKLDQQPVLGWINSYTVKESFPGKPAYWERADKPLPIPVEQLTLPAGPLPEQVLNFNLDPDGGGLIHLLLLDFEDGKQALVVSVNHCFTDYRGVQQLVNWMVGEAKNLPQHWVSEPDIELPFFPKLKSSLAIVGFMLKTMAHRMATIGNRKQTVPNKIKWKDYSEEESRVLDREMSKHGLSLLPNVYFLGWTLLRFHALGHLPKGKLVWVSVPIDSRKKGGDVSILGNSLWFMFYRLSTNVLAQGEKAVFEELKRQTLEQMKAEWPKKYAIMASWWKGMPHGLYSLFVKMPSLGKVSTLSFSNLGPCFPDLQEAFGKPITGIQNLPSNPSPPGLGLVVMKWNGRYALNFTSELEVDFSF